MSAPSPGSNGVREWARLMSGPRCPFWQDALLCLAVVLVSAIIVFGVSLLVTAAHAKPSPHARFQKDCMQMAPYNRKWRASCRREAP